MTQSSQVPPSSGWNVTGQNETQQLGSGGHFTKGVEVSFVTGHGVNGSVFVPDATYTPQNVYDAVSARAAQLDAVTALSALPSA